MPMGSSQIASISSFIDETSAIIIPWSSDKDKSNVMKGDDRKFYYLKSDIGLATYTDDFGLQWTQLYDDYRKDRYKHLDQFLRLGYKPDFLDGKNCLDVGCGLGRLSEIALGRANYVFGVDMSAAIPEAARVIRSDKFIPVQASADQMPLKSGSFDFVYCWGVLHHTQNPSKTLQELWRVLKPGGTLAIWVYPRSDWYLKRSLLTKYFSSLDEHEMLDFATFLTSLSHTTQLTSNSYLQMLASDLCYTIKNTKEYTRHILYDGLGPNYHYLLDSEWFKMNSSRLNNVESIDSVDHPYTVARIKKSL
ncbi:class I SAM-dependent methyltransferase [Synechococcus sp. AH-551-A10]|nr:class I SAM-dependent methyltransferase [Synechococcus sp. AH-551-A10]MDB4682080.1 class I SAM-dependent methyltransferase [Synechococcus sp. AH-551-A10]